MPHGIHRTLTWPKRIDRRAEKSWMKTTLTVHRDFNIENKQRVNELVDEAIKNYWKSSRMSCLFSKLSTHYSIEN